MAWGSQDCAPARPPTGFGLFVLSKERPVSFCFWPLPDALLAHQEEDKGAALLCKLKLSSGLEFSLISNTNHLCT